MSRTNLLKETIEDLSRHNKTIDDIRWIGSKDCQIPLEDIAKYQYEDQKLSETCLRAADAIEELENKLNL